MKVSMSMDGGRIEDESCRFASEDPLASSRGHVHQNYSGQPLAFRHAHTDAKRRATRRPWAVTKLWHFRPHLLRLSLPPEHLPSCATRAHSSLLGWTRPASPLLPVFGIPLVCAKLSARNEPLEGINSAGHLSMMPAQLALSSLLMVNRVFMLVKHPRLLNESRTNWLCSKRFSSLSPSLPP
jgi:hypothetical protein